MTSRVFFLVSCWLACAALYFHAYWSMPLHIGNMMLAFHAVVRKDAR